MKAIKEEINFSDERKYFQNEINELHVVYFFHKKNMKMFALQLFISKLEKELETQKQKNQDLLQRNINYSEDLSQKFDQELEIERLKENLS